MQPNAPQNQSVSSDPATLPALAMPAPQMSGAAPVSAPGVQGAVPVGIAASQMPASAQMPGQAPGQPVGIPGMPMPGLPGQQMPAAPGRPAPAVSVADAEHAAAKAEQLTTAYAQDPFQLATLFGDLKTDYLARKHNITPNSAGN